MHLQVLSCFAIRVIDRLSKTPACANASRNEPPLFLSQFPATHSLPISLRAACACTRIVQHLERMRLNPVVFPVCPVNPRRFQVPITRKEDGCIAYAAAVDVAAGVPAISRFTSACACALLWPCAPLTPRNRKPDLQQAVRSRFVRCH